MALIIISLLVLIPLALLVWDLPRPSRYTSAENNHADVEPNAPRVMGTALRVHA